MYSSLFITLNLEGGKVMKRSIKKIVVCLLVSVIIMTSLSALRPISVEAYDDSELDKIGCTHVGGNYSLTSDNYLMEGANEVQKIGFSCIKLFLKYRKVYVLGSS